MRVFGISALASKPHRRCTAKALCSSCSCAAWNWFCSRSRPARFMLRSSSSARGSSRATNKAVFWSGTRPRTRHSSKAGLQGSPGSLAVVGSRVLVKLGAEAPCSKMSATRLPSSISMAPCSSSPLLQ
ncbi:hypothetical protein D3C77_497710 [compost metagenome]